MSQIAQRLLGMNEKQIFETDFSTSYPETRKLEQERNLLRIELKRTPRALRRDFTAKIFSIFN